MSTEERDEVLRSVRQHVMDAYKDIADLPHGNEATEESKLLKEQVRALLAAMKRRGMAIELPASSTDRVTALAAATCATVSTAAIRCSSA